MRYLINLIVIATWCYMVWLQIAKENYLIATMIALPLPALFLFLLFPLSGFGHFAFTSAFGPVQRENESKKKFLFRLSKWWAFGATVFPVSHVLSQLLPLEHAAIFLPILIGYIFGIACFIKLIGCLYKAIRTPPYQSGS